jgi:KDO2-lipid IV(A) lauroyltransferase
MSPPGADPFAHRVQYAAFRGARWLLGALPRSIALGLGDVLGWIMGVVLRIRRRVVDDNLLQAFPEEDARWRGRVARSCYRHLVRESIATFLMAGKSREEVLALASMDDDELSSVDGDLEEGKGLVVMTGHLGNWELGGAWTAARGVPIEAVVQVQRNRRFDEDLREVRERVWMKTIPKQDAPRGVLKALRAGHLVALVADQNLSRGGIFVEFFGRLASTAKGPATFALRTGAPLWIGAALRVRGQSTPYRLRFQRIDVTPTGDTEADIRRMTEAYTQVLESWIRSHPEQYFWHHRRWKTRPEGRERPPSASDITD